MCDFVPMRPKSPPYFYPPRWRIEIENHDTNNNRSHPLERVPQLLLKTITYTLYGYNLNYLSQNFSHIYNESIPTLFISLWAWLSVGLFDDFVALVPWCTGAIWWIIPATRFDRVTSELWAPRAASAPCRLKFCVLLMFYVAWAMTNRFFKTTKEDNTGDRFRSCDLPLIRR